MKKVILILIAITAIATGCNKNDQALKKIYGNYALKTYTVDGVDSLSLFRDCLGTGFNFYRDDIDYFNNLRIDGSTASGSNEILDCRWELTNNYKTLSIYKSFGASGTGPFGRDRLSDWDILSNTTILKMKTVYNGKEYLIEIIST